MFVFDFLALVVFSQKRTTSRQKCSKLELEVVSIGAVGLEPLLCGGPTRARAHDMSAVGKGVAGRLRC